MISILCIMLFWKVNRSFPPFHFIQCLGYFWKKRFGCCWLSFSFNYFIIYCFLYHFLFCRLAKVTYCSVVKHKEAVFQCGSMHFMVLVSSIFSIKFILFSEFSINSDWFEVIIFPFIVMSLMYVRLNFFRDRGSKVFCHLVILCFDCAIVIDFQYLVGLLGLFGSCVDTLTFIC